MSPRRVATLLLVLLLVTVSGRAAEKPVLFIDFQMSVFENEFDDLEALAGKVEERVVTELKGAIRFVEIQPTPDVAQDPDVYTLHLELLAQDARPDTRLREVGIAARLSGPEVPATAETYWKLYPADQWMDPVPDEADFLDDISDQVREADTSELVERVLSHVRVTSESTILKEGTDPFNGWKVPFEKRDLCIETGSRLLFRHDVVIGELKIRRDFHADLIGVDSFLCEPVTNEEDFADLIDVNNTVENNSVYVLRYILLPQCEPESEVVSPDEVLAALGGGT